MQLHGEHWAEELIGSFGLAPAAPSAVRLHQDGGESAAALFATMSSAAVRLDICTYILGNDAFGREAIQRMIERARSRGTPVLVDPKGEDYLRYRGATLLTPNRAEFREVAGSWRSEAELAAKAQSLRAELALDALLITRSEEGMSLYTDAGVQHIPAQAREVYDVSGAGDTVIATIGALLGARADLSSAVRIANLAAGIVVGKLGTAVVHPEELSQ
jgi:rfaE bifunctional protein kinase chain/domain